MQNLQIYPLSVVFSAACLLSFLTVTIVPSYIYYPLPVLALLATVFLINEPFRIDKRLAKYLLFFLLPPSLGLATYYLSFFLPLNPFDYHLLNPFGRIVNLLIWFPLIMLLHRYYKDKNILQPFRYYRAGALILLMTALWHALAVYTGLIPFPFETRSHLHSTGGLEFSIAERITGIASEPSYFVMFAIDFIVLSLLLSSGYRKIIAIAFGTILLALSASPSGFVTFFLTVAFSFFLLNVTHITLKIKAKRLLFYALASAAAIAATFYIVTTDIFIYTINRVATPEIIKSPRAYMSLMPFVWATDSSPINFLFGHGIKSYSIIGSMFNIPSGSAVHVTSNNIYADMFWESGLFGLLILCLFMLYILKKIVTSEQSKRQKFIALMVTFDLIFSGLFRADFASFRYFILLYLIYVLIYYDFDNILYPTKPQKKRIVFR